MKRTPRASTVVASAPRLPPVRRCRELCVSAAAAAGRPGGCWLPRPRKCAGAHGAAANAEQARAGQQGTRAGERARCLRLRCAQSQLQSEKQSPKSSSALGASAAAVARGVGASRASFAAADSLVQDNLRRVLDAFSAERVGLHVYSESSGYGHEDAGRDATDAVFARVVGAEAAAVRPQFMCGTHAIACALYGALRPGDELLAVAGHPYDTMEEVIGLRGREGDGSLREMGVTYQEAPLDKDGGVDLAAVTKRVTPRTKCALIQRSRGYASRRTLSVQEIGEAAAAVKAANPACVVVVDNCYGEFTERSEPCVSEHVDIIAGSLIKNPGGTIARGGGYVAGRREAVLNAVARLSAPGVGFEAGAVSATDRRLILQGLFLAPQMTGEALKGAILVSEVMQLEGYAVSPAPDEARFDVIQSVELGSPEALQAFCSAIQKRSPVGSYIEPVPGATAGYEDEVLFADGTFIEGSTAELSADGPLREPFVAYCQGGTTWTHWAIALEGAVQALRELKQ